MNKCQTCGAELRQLFTGTFCPNDCDRGKLPVAAALDWDSLDLAGKRVAIAQDVIFRLDAKRFIPNNGHFFKPGAFGGEPGLDDPGCSACALGGMFMSRCGLEKKRLMISAYGCESQYERISAELGSLFDFDQLALIECAFERGAGYMRSKHGVPSEIWGRAVHFLPGERDPAIRMRSIMENIVQNGGTFLV